MCFNPVETGERIRRLREHLGYSQTQLSEKINFSRSYISKVEVGIRIPSIDFLMEVSDFAGVTFVKDLFSGKQVKNIGQEQKVLICDHHPAIISRELFAKVSPHIDEEIYPELSLS